MTGGGDDRTLPTSSPADGGEFLLQLLRRPPLQPPTPPLPSPAQNLSLDPAVAAVGPSFPFSQIPANGHDLSYYRPPWPPSPHFAPHNFFLQGFPQTPSPSPSWSPSPPHPSEFNRNLYQNLHANHQHLGDNIQNLGFQSPNPRSDSAHQHEQNLMFGSLPCEIRSNEGVRNGNTHNKTSLSVAKADNLLLKQSEIGERNRRLNGLKEDFQNSLNSSRNMQRNSPNQEQDRRISGCGVWGRQQHSGNFRAGVSSSEVKRFPPGFPTKPSNSGNWESGKESFEHNVDKKISFGELSHRGFTSNHDGDRGKTLLPEHGKSSADSMFEPRSCSQLESPGPPTGSNLYSVPASDIEESPLAFHAEIDENGAKPTHGLRHDARKGGGPVKSELDDVEELLKDSLVLEDGSGDKSNGKLPQVSRDKDYRSDTRGQTMLGQRMRMSKRQVRCRSDIDRLNASFLAIYESLIPPDEEKAKQKQLLTLLEKLVRKKWPEARLYLYGSCANSFGVLKSDIDVCLAIDNPDIDKSEILMQLAGILQSDDLQNVQALTRARVPIVKLMDPATGISCDICINNVLAVVNTKLLRDYATIDVRLRQLAFIVKHWAKSRAVNETYHGTLSSYAYVLMCIHFLQQRRPAILPCLQRMDRTYDVTVDNIECAYFDQVEKISGFGSRNRESIAQLVWAFFNYWAYCHDYANDVISVRTGCILSKRVKDWTRRIGNDRHLICIEDPFEISHDLGRVVDKKSIRVLREEFERAAEIMQYDPNPCVTLFEPYIRN